LSRDASNGETVGAPLRAGAPGGRTRLRDNLEYIAVLILIVLLLRQVVVEAFRIRHGSMAPTLLGLHQEIRCRNCGWVFPVGSDKAGYAGDVECPNCGDHWDGASLYDSSGARIVFQMPEWLWNAAWGRNGLRLETADAADRVYRGASRIFVNKFIYRLRNPRRWEVVVFLYPYYSVECESCGWRAEVRSLENLICPDCGSRNLRVSTKNFIKRVAGLPTETVSLRDGDVYINGVLARKPRSVQEGFWFHVFDSRFMPQHQVEPLWDLGPAAGRAQVLSQGQLVVDGQGASGPAMVAFARRVVDFYSYDGPGYDVAPRTFGASGRNLVGDCRIRARARVVECDASGGAVVLNIEDGGHDLSLAAGTGSRAGLLLEDNGHPVRQADVPSLPLHDAQWLVLENYDDRVVARIGSREVLSYDYQGRPGAGHAVRLGAQGARVVFDRVVIERDIYYENVAGSSATVPTYGLKKGEYFVLGDNSPASSDSRRWKEPGVPRENLIGQAFLVFWPVHHMRWLAFWGSD